MKVFFTGATGFIGAHTAMAYIDAGHELRLLARDPDACQSYFEKMGYTVGDIVQGDMTDKALMVRNLEGCDALFHGAAMVSLHPKDKKQVYENNVNSIDAVIGTAVELGIENIVYVSSLGALFQNNIAEINELTPLGDPKEAYSRSKRDCEIKVRELRKHAPIQMSYPSGVFGPDDPKLNESNNSLITFVSSLVPNTSAGIQCVDVRDVAKAHLHMLENPCKDNGRFIVAGHFYPWPEFHQLLEKVSGNRISHPKIPGSLFRVIGKVVDSIKYVYPLGTPIGGEAMDIVTQWVPANSQKYIQASGESFLTGEKTFSDTLDWLVKAGYMDAKFYQNK